MSGDEQVLVVDDDEDIREVLREVLTTQGYTVEVGKDGQEALDKLEGSTRAPVILLDIMMPNMDGDAFLTELRRRPALASAPVVIISGSTGARELARKHAVTADLGKPFELDDLLDLVRRLVHAQDLARASDAYRS